MPAITVEDTTELAQLPRLPDQARQRPIRQVTDAPRGFEGEGFPVRRAFAGVDLADLDPLPPPWAATPRSCPWPPTPCSTTTIWSTPPYGYLAFDLPGFKRWLLDGREPEHPLPRPLRRRPPPGVEPPGL
jgi:hypothetical protein